MKEFWNERYANPDYAYGKEPNEYLREKLTPLPKGKILLPADGESRNGVFAATLGWDVTSFDMSESGRVKALQLAKEKNVTINYLVANMDDITLENSFFDAVAMTYAHFPGAKRIEYSHKILNSLKPGGHIIFEAFSKSQIKYQATHKSGGPNDPNMLYSIEDVQYEFNGIEFSELQEVVIELKEGKFHQGLGSVIRFMGIKK